MSKKSKSQTSHDIRYSTVKIVNEKGDLYGTGFFININQKKYCITTHTCIFNLNEIFIEKQNKIYSAHWLKNYSAPEKAIAVLEVENCPITPLLYNKVELLNSQFNIWGYSIQKIKDYPDGMPKTGLISAPMLNISWIAGKQ